MISTTFIPGSMVLEIRYGKSRLNAKKTKCMQEVVCGCSVSDSVLTKEKFVFSMIRFVCVKQY